MGKTVGVLLTPIVMVAWALIIAVTGWDYLPARLGTIAIAIAIQAYSLYCKYEDEYRKAIAMRELYCKYEDEYRKAIGGDK